MSNLGAYFYDTEGKRLASDNETIPIPLFNDMKITFHELDDDYYVVDWSYHHGHHIEEAGLRIVLRHVGERSVNEDRESLSI
jgi:hypothetical protein